MHPYTSHVLREWLHASDNQSFQGNSYNTLTLSSRALLDFHTGKGLSVGVSNSPTAHFANSAILNAFQGGEVSKPFLAGSIAYMHYSPGVRLNASKNARLHKFVEHFAVPARPLIISDKVSTNPLAVPPQRDHFVFGSLHLPEPRLDGLWVSKLSPKWLGMASLISNIPQSPPTRHTLASSAATETDLEISNRTLPRLFLSLQQDTARWASDYSYSFPDHLMGFRVLHNFGVKQADADDREEDLAAKSLNVITTDLDSIETGGAGLKGRFSAGAEVYFSAVTKSGGLSTGVRFATSPEQRSIYSDTALLPSQAPTVLTATLNPIMGHISTAVASQISRDVAIASRYDFNFHSFLSELVLGAEWWQRGSQPGSTSPAIEKQDQLAPFWTSVRRKGVGERVSVIKARISTSSELSLSWEARLAGCLVGIGLNADLAETKCKSIGLSIQYCSSSA